MKNLKKTHELIRQNEQSVKASQKHEVNLQINATLYFQMGLIVVLLLIYGLFEMKFETTVFPEVALAYPTDNTFYVDDYQFTDEIKKEKQVEVQSQVIKKSQVFTEVPDDVSFDDLKNDHQPIEQVDNTPFNPNDIILDKTPVDDEVSFEKVEIVPIYPGCENKKTNEDKRQCMSDKITKLIQRKFNAQIADELGLIGKQVIQTQFKIDKTGQVTDIKVRAAHPELAQEAQHVINLIPNMIPGKQRETPVGVIYSLPIIFKVQN